MIYAERLLKPGGSMQEKGIFMSLEELALADAAARENGGCWSGGIEANIALNRYRDNRCMFCGATVGLVHVDCIRGQVNTNVYINPMP